MAKGANVTIKGGERLLARLERLGVDVNQALEAAAVAGAMVIANGANPRAPAPLIDVEVVERGKGRVTVDVGPPDEKWYWRFKETGAAAHEITGSPLVFEGDEGLIITAQVQHKGMAADPFLRPAFDEEKDWATGAVAKRLRQAVEP